MGGAVAVFTADLGLFASGWPSFVRDHPSILWLGLVIGLALLVWGWLVPNENKESSPVAPQSTSEVGHIEQKVESASSSSAATGNQFSLVQNFHGAVSAFTPQQSEPASGESREAIPTLVLGFAKLGIDREEQIIRFKDGGPAALVVSVVNSPAAQGEFGRDASSVFCTVTFTEAMGRRTIVSRACWIGRESSEIPINVGDVENILIGFPTQDAWVTFHNPNKFSADHFEWTHIWSDLESRTVNWGDGAFLTVDMRIVSTGSASRGQTFAHRVFQLSRNGIAYNARWLE